MRKISDIDETKLLIVRKRVHEDNLADAIYSAFNQGDLLRELNDMVRIAATRMQKWQNWDVPERKYRELGKMDMSLDVSRKYGGSAAKIAYAASKNMLSAKSCGELMRLYGEVAEKIQSMDRERVSYQKHKDLGIWDKKRGGARQRVLARETIDPSSEKRGVARKVDPAVFGAQYVGPRTIARRTSLEMEVLGGGGISRWKPTEEDVMFRVERTFGLKVGATISGTTTDALYFLETVPKSVDPIFYLLPVATIAAQKHHSLAEVAAALTINGKMSYSIGFYETLMPHHANHREKPRIMKILEEYQHDGFNNKLFIVHRSNLANLTGCYLYENAGDKAAFKSLAFLDKKLLQEFKALNKGYATEDDLIRWTMHRRRTRGTVFLGWN